MMCIVGSSVVPGYPAPRITAPSFLFVGVDVASAVAGDASSVRQDGVLATYNGLTIVLSKWLPRPRYERERFSGGRNLSAIARNKASERECAEVLRDGDTLFVPYWMRHQFIAALQKAENCVRVEIRPSSPRHLGILISNRVPMAEAGEHPMYAGHPTLKAHLAKLGEDI